MDKFQHTRFRLIWRQPKRFPTRLPYWIYVALFPVVGHQNSGSLWSHRLQNYAKATSIGVMITALFAMLAYLRAFLIARHRLAMEAVALRQQLAVYKRKQSRPKLNQFDRLFY
jgi:hypothetical protein